MGGEGGSDVEQASDPGAGFSSDQGSDAGGSDAGQQRRGVDFHVGSDDDGEGGAEGNGDQPEGGRRRRKDYGQVWCPEWVPHVEAPEW